MVLGNLQRSYDLERRHLKEIWQDRTWQEFSWTKGRVASVLPRLRVRRISPASPSEPWAYVTLGGFEATGDVDDHGLEFVLLSPSEYPLHVELLAMVVLLHSDPTYRLDVGSIVDIGRPWIAGSQAAHLLVSSPHIFNPRLEVCRLGDNRHVRYLWLVPIFESEARYARSSGSQRLEELLEAARANLLSPARSSVVS